MVNFGVLGVLISSTFSYMKRVNTTSIPTIVQYILGWGKPHQTKDQSHNLDIPLAHSMCWISGGSQLPTFLGEIGISSVDITQSFQTLKKSLVVIELAGGLEGFLFRCHGLLYTLPALGDISGEWRGPSFQFNENKLCLSK